MKLKKLASLALAGALTLGLLPALSSPALATGGDTNTYTVTIPSELTVNDKGWNEITGGIKAKGTLESGKKLTVTATSTTNSYKLKSGENEIGYNLAKTGDSNSTYNASAEVPKWEFAELKANEDTTLTAGIIVEDYSTKPAGTYTDTVTFTAKVEDAAITVTINQSDWGNGYSGSFTKDGVTVSAEIIDSQDGNLMGGGTFSTTLGNFTKIVVTTLSCSASGTGWSGSRSSMTWAGTPASTVSFSGEFMGRGRTQTTIVCTIEPAN